MSTPLYKFIRGSKNDPNGSLAGFTTYVLPGAAEDISAQNQNVNYSLNFSKFVLLNLDLSKMNLTNPDEFNTESFNIITDQGDLLVNSLRNYVANEEEVIRNTKINNNTYFYDSNQVHNVTERVFWKWLRKSGAIQFEPALPNEEYVDSTQFAVNDNAPDDFFKEYLWKERSINKYNVTNIVDTGNLVVDPNNNLNFLKIFEISLSESTTIKPNDTVNIVSAGTFNIFDTVTEMQFVVDSVDTSLNENNKNNIVRIQVDQSVAIFWNNFAVVTLQLVYNRVVQYIGEVSSINNVQVANRSYTEVTAYIPDQNGQTPDVLFRIGGDVNYGPGNQYPILPSQDQPEIIGGELADSPIVVSPENYPGDQYAYFDVDQKYLNSAGALDRRRGDYFGVLETNRKKDRVASSPFVFPEFDGSKLDGVGMDFDPAHYVRMNLPAKVSKNFDEFNAQTFNNLPPLDFKFNVIMWYYEVNNQAVAGTTAGINLYGITILNPVTNGLIEPYTKLVSNGKQDGLSYQFNINLNFNISSDNIIEAFDPQKVYSIFGFDLYNEVMRRIATTNDIFLQLVSQLTVFQSDIATIKTLLYTQTDISTINARIDSISALIDQYKSLQIVDSDTIKVTVDNTQSPPQLILDSKDSRFGLIQELPVSTLYNTQNNTVIDNNILVPAGKDFLLNVINDDNADLTLDRPLNIVLSRDLDYRQTCVIKVFPNSSKFNKKLNISVVSLMVPNVDTTKGFALINSLDLPIDTNLNPNVVTNSLTKRWGHVPTPFYPERVFIRKVSDNYFISLELKPLLTNAFKTGDVLTLENFNLVFTNFQSNISGQYTIVGDILNNRINFQVTLSTFIQLFKLINDANANISNEYELTSTYFTQPASFRVNTGYTISITNVSRVATSISANYQIEILPLQMEKL